MKASDTVMSDEQIGDRMIPAVSPFHSGKLLAKIQAEISFKAGIKESSKVYDKYIALLGDELNEVVGIASVHGWKSSRYDNGIKCRKEITKLKELGLALAP